MTRHIAVALTVSGLALSAAAAPAQIPSFAEVTGHEFGERITQHHQAIHYLQRLAELSDRVRIVEQGETWEGRLLLAAIVTAPRNHERLDAIRQTAQRLADPRITGPGEAASLMQDQPVDRAVGCRGTAETAGASGDAQRCRHARGAREHRHHHRPDAQP